MRKRLNLAQKLNGSITLTIDPEPFDSLRSLRANAEPVEAEHSRRVNGFTLFEIVIAGLLMSAIIMVILNVYVISKKTISYTNRYMQALEFCRLKTESLRSDYKFFESPLSDGQHGDFDIPQDFPLGKNYSGKWSYDIEDIDDNTDGKIDYKRITVYVKWTE